MFVIIIRAMERIQIKVQNPGLTVITEGCETFMVIKYVRVKREKRWRKSAGELS